jgi:N-acetylmuramoyl-L-alanine amidase
MTAAADRRRPLERWRCATPLALAPLVLALVLLSSPADAPARIPALTSATAERSGPIVEIHLGFRGPAPRWNITTNGNQLRLDFDRIALAVAPDPLPEAAGGAVAAVRAIDLGGGRVRVAVEVNGKADYAIARLPNEIVLRVAPAGAAPNLAAPLLTDHRRVVRPAPRVASASREVAPPPEIRRPPPAPELKSAAPAYVQPPAPPPPTRASAAPAYVQPPAPQASAPPAIESPQHPLVMIDPGHGGDDPGTISETGINEKDVALAVSQRLKSELEARGLRCTMTRTSDVFVPLPERTLLANRANADLFVSIHMNSSPNLETTGIEVYYLNNTTDRATIRLAKMENASAADYGAGSGPNLNYILTDLRQQYKAAESASLARMIDAQAAAEAGAGSGIDVNPLGAKMGPFYVLVGAHMPAVLVECGFLSNRVEAVRLSSGEYQELLARGIADAVVHYFNADAAVGNL